MTNLGPNYKDFDKSGNYNKYRELKRIGIFDSGVGGLSVLKYLALSMDDKQENKEIIYLADTGRFPYGMKSNEEILQYTQQIILWLEKQNVELIVFGCNTANAVVGNKLRQLSKLPIIDLIDPVARYVSQLGLSVGVLATQATVSSHAFQRAINKYSPDLQITEIAATQLVNIVEKGHSASAESQHLLGQYIDQLSSKNVQLLVLGCTHFSFLKEYLEDYAAGRIQIIDPAELIAQLLNRSMPTLANPYLNVMQGTKFFVTGDLQAFKASASKCLGTPLKNVNNLPIAVLENI